VQRPEAAGKSRNEWQIEPFGVLSFQNSQGIRRYKALDKLINIEMIEVCLGRDDSTSTD
jgi:hypothetical protein